MVAVKLKPAAITQLFGVSMQQITDQTIAIADFENPKLRELN
jgi:hypothetical protein